MKAKRRRRIKLRMQIASNQLFVDNHFFERIGSLIAEFNLKQR